VLKVRSKEFKKYKSTFYLFSEFLNFNYII